MGESVKKGAAFVKTFLYLVAFGICCQAITPSSVEGFDIQLGPVQLQGRVNDLPLKITPPICYAIAHRKLLNIVVETEEVLSKDESVITIEQITIEPYLFGRDQDNKPVIRGNIVASEFIKETTIKLGKKLADANRINSEKIKKKGFFSNLFSSKRDKSSYDTVNLRNVLEIQVIQPSRFELPKNLADIKSSLSEIYCTVPENKQEA